MKPLARDFLVGLTVLLGVAGLVLLLLFFGELTFDNNYKFGVRLQSAGGLAQGSRVTMSGVSIGQIQKAEILAPSVGGVQLYLKVNDTIKIPRKSLVNIEKGLIGDAALDFVVPTTLTEAELKDVVTSGDIFEGGNPRSMFDKLASSIDKPLAQLESTAKKIEAFADVYTEVGRKVSDALEPRTQADVRAGMAPNIRSTIERIDTFLASADGLINDEQLRNDLKGVVSKAHKAMDDASAVVADVRKAAAKAETILDSADKAVASTSAAITTAAQTATEKLGSIGEQANASLKSVEDAAAKLGAALEKATQGGGTVGQLMNNPDLYNSLRDAAVRLDRALTEFQLMAEKIKTEGVRLRL